MAGQKRVFALDVPAIHVLRRERKTWAARHAAGHDGAIERYGVIETGEKSTNQLFGCTKPLIFGLSARGPTSWAT
jgi:hypothetical protein